MNRLPWFLTVCFIAAAIMACGPSNTAGERGGALRVGELPVDLINEASGLAASRNNLQKLWVHNDSGDEPRIFLIDAHGRLIAQVWLEGVRNRDWEDIAVGPGPQAGTAYIYVGDIGDNWGRHATKRIYRFEEPTIPTGVADTTIRNLDSIVFRLPGGSVDAEALLVDPVSGDILILTKQRTRTDVYCLPFPQSTDSTITARKLLSISPRRVTAGDISADGRGILIKTYDTVYFWRRTPGEAISQVLGRRPGILPYDVEPQGEAIAFDREGSGYFTVSESTYGAHPDLFFYKLQPQADEQVPASGFIRP